MSEIKPDGWASARVDGLYDCWGGMTPSTGNRAYWGGTLPWVSSKDLKGHGISKSTEMVTDLALRETRLRKCRPGTVLTVVRSGVLAHTLPVAITDREVVINQDLKALDSRNDDVNRWLVLYLRAYEREILNENRKDGTTVQSIRLVQLLERDIPLPPIAEQRRIVERVEALLTRVSTARERLTRVPRLLERFRQAVLAAACEGRLTEAWRGAHPLAGDDSPSDELPASWNLIDAGTAYVDARYGTSVRCELSVPGGVPVLRVPNIAKAHIDLTDLKFAESEAIPASLRLEEGDIIICRANGSLDLIGKAAVISNLPSSFSFASYLIRLRLDSGLLLPAYFHLFLSSPTGRDQLMRDARTSAGQYNLNLQILRSLIVPEPPIPEQQEIVRRVQALFSLAEAIERRVTAALARAEKLPQAILSRAFAGELVPTEAELARAEGRSYETAAELLERIRREREGAAQAGKSKRPRKKAAAARDVARSGIK